VLPFEDRYTRQRQLPEVGMAGQARIAEHVASLISEHPLANEVARAYLARAGVRRFETPPHRSQVSFPHAQYFESVEARQFAEGAHLALSQLRHALGLAPASRAGD
jgi:hypothetical protein